MSKVMNRPFKFRAWFARAQVFLPVEWLEFWEHANGETYATVHTRTDFERGGWFSRVQEHTNRLTSLDGNKTQVPRVHLMQYTGLKDKNGVEIYEGDIVQASHRSQRDDEITLLQEQVRFLNGCFMFGNWNAHEYFSSHRYIEVIGNIYENPELVE